jgi:hypothetical protein
MNALIAFLRRSQAAGHGLVIVVTGKGRAGSVGEPVRGPRGVEAARAALAPLPDLRPFVIGFEEAGPHHGGAGRALCAASPAARAAAGACPALAAGGATLDPAAGRCERPRHPPKPVNNGLATASRRARARQRHRRRPGPDRRGLSGRRGRPQGAMQLIDEARAEHLYEAMGAATVVSGGSGQHGGRRRFALATSLADLSRRCARRGSARFHLRIFAPPRSATMSPRRTEGRRPPQLHPGDAGRRAHHEHLSRAPART